MLAALAFVQSSASRQALGFDPISLRDGDLTRALGSLGYGFVAEPSTLGRGTLSHEDRTVGAAIDAYRQGFQYASGPRPYLNALHLSVGLNLGEVDSVSATADHLPGWLPSPGTAFVPASDHLAIAFIDIPYGPTGTRKGLQRALDGFWYALDAFARRYRAHLLPVGEPAWKDARFPDDIRIDLASQISVGRLAVSRRWGGEPYTWELASADGIEEQRLGFSSRFPSDRSSRPGLRLVADATPPSGVAPKAWRDRLVRVAGEAEPPLRVDFEENGFFGSRVLIDIPALPPPTVGELCRRALAFSRVLRLARAKP